MISRKALWLLRFVYQNFLRRRVNLVRKYGSNSWVVVTGASDGIGKQIALKLGHMGFNIVLIARNKEKLQKVQEELMCVRGGLKSEIVVCDFKDCWDDAKFFDRIMERVSSLDISMLVNNVGVDAFDMFHKQSD